MSDQLQNGTRAPPIATRDIHGCPICNLHLQTFIARHGEIEAARIREVAVFHSPGDALLPY